MPSDLASAKSGNAETLKKIGAKEKILKKYLQNGKTLEVLRVLKDLYTLYDEVLEKPHKKLVLTENNLYQCLLHLYGLRRY